MRLYELMNVVESNLNVYGNDNCRYVLMYDAYNDYFYTCYRFDEDGNRTSIPVIDIEMFEVVLVSKSNTLDVYCICYDE